MKRESIESAYAPFVASLRSGGHAEPAEGWPAELVAAHVAVNNDLIAAAAEAVAGGHPEPYDNAGAVSEATLREFAARAGGLAGLAAEVERSAARLAAARDLLDDGQAATEIPVRIVDGGSVVADRPVPIGDLVDGNAGFHLEMHREQLRALEPPRMTGPPGEFDTYEVVLYRRGDAERADDETEAELQRQHLGHFVHLKASAGLLLTGPLSDQADETLLGFGVFRTGSVETARRLAEDDPRVRAGRLRVEVVRWYTAKGALQAAAG